MNLLTMEHITKAYTTRILLDDVNFSINSDEKIGVIGVNGMGKSTLLKIIAGIEDYEAGSISMGNQVRVGYLPQTPVFEAGMTVLEAAVGENRNDINQWSIEADAKAMLNGLGITDHDELVEHLSGGQKKRIALVHTLLTSSEILVLDEPTNHLDNAMSEWLENFLINYRGTLVMVTHDRYFLDRVVNRIVEVDKGKLYSYPGSYSEFIRLKEERENSALATERKRKSLLRTELQWLMRGARARSTKQKAHIDRIKAMQAIEDIQAERKIEMESMASRMGRKTIEVHHLSKAFGDKVLFEDFNYNFVKSDRIGIIGPNGCGKSTLIKILNGLTEADNGEIEIGQTVKIGYFSQENEYMDESLKAIEYIKEVGEFIRTADGLVSASNLMERFLFDGTMQWSKIEKLSGGERRRLYLMRILMSSPNVLILDEPTNDLDIQTLTVLEDYLDAFDGIIIIVSHDRYFLDRTVQRLFAFEGNGVIRQYEGNYSDYLIRKELESLPEEEDIGTFGHKSGAAKGAAAKSASQVGDDSDTSARNSWKVKEKKLKFTYKEEKEFRTIDDDIAALEAKIEELDAAMAVNATNAGKLNEIIREKEAAEEQLAEKMERWVYLNELYEKINEAAAP